LGALGLVDLVSNHDGSGRISPCESLLSRKKASLKKLILKFFTDLVVPDSICRNQGSRGKVARMMKIIFDVKRCYLPTYASLSGV
jgi:hypothetical protein